MWAGEWGPATNRWSEAPLECPLSGELEYGNG